jgi:magnesium transporter
MIDIYARLAPDAPLTAAPDLAPNDERTLWIDLDTPTEAEEVFVETALGIDVPTHAERAAMEESARFYEESGTLVLTATLLGRRDEGPFVADAVMFVLVAGKLVTVRMIRPRAFEIEAGRASARIAHAATAGDVLSALLEGIVERIADRIGEVRTEAERLSARIFTDMRAPNLRNELRALGLVGALLSQSLESLGSVSRLIVSASAAAPRHGLDAACLDRLRRDCEELDRIGAALQKRLTFLLDAAVGLVSVGQNEILKALSVATIAFVPPTLIASVFGMNFKHMTWFDAPWGPWIGFALMLAAPAALFGIAKWRRWF